MQLIGDANLFASADCLHSKLQCRNVAPNIDLEARINVTSCYHVELMINGEANLLNFMRRIECACSTFGWTNVFCNIRYRNPIVLCISVITNNNSRRANLNSSYKANCDESTDTWRNGNDRARKAVLDCVGLELIVSYLEHCQVELNVNENYNYNVNVNIDTYPICIIDQYPSPLRK